jgi:hypothetical protein
MELIVSPCGTITCVYGELLGLSELGQLSIRRVSTVEPDERGRWWADLSPVKGPRLGPFSLRSSALEAERHWVDRHVLTSDSPAVSQQPITERNGHGCCHLVPACVLPARHPRVG